jgi:hypothetical protein
MVRAGSWGRPAVWVVILAAACSSERSAPANRDTDPAEVTDAAVSADEVEIRPEKPDASESEIHPGWLHVSTPCQYTFEAPPDVLVLATAQTQSCVVLYEAAGCKFLGTRGGISDSLGTFTSAPDYLESRARVDGLNAKIISFGPAADGNYLTAIHLPDGAGAAVTLTLFANCETQDGQATAQVMFATIDILD